MLCKQFLFLLLLVVQLHQKVGAQKGGGFITEAPQRRVVPIGSNVSFACSATNGSILWEINSLQITGRSQQDTFNNFNIFSPLPTVGYSVVNVTNVTYEHNDTTFECVVEGVSKDNAPIILERSDAVKLLVYGEPSPPSNLNLTLPIQGTSIHLSWTPGLAVDGEEVIFVITSFNLASGTSSELYVNASSVYLAPSPQGRSCQYFNFTVRSENGFGRSNTGDSEETIIPTAPYALEGNEINVTMLLQGGLVIVISFDAPSPCQDYNVEEYIFMFTEVASSNAEGGQPTPFNVSHYTASLNVTFVLTSSDGVRRGKQYNATLLAINMAGFSHSTFTFYTTDLQSSIVVLDHSKLYANITCIFVRGTSALGCSICIGNHLQVNVTRENGSSIAMKNVLLSNELTDEFVTVAELMSDGTVSLITQQVAVEQLAQTTITTPISDLISTTTPILDITSESSSPETTSQQSLNITSNSNSILQQSILFIVIGGIVGIILILLLIIIVVTCVIRSNHKKNRRLHSLTLSSAEGPKPNNIYGDTALQSPLIDVTGMTFENNHHTCDNLHNEVTNGGGATPVIPTYETVQSAKKGGSVLNPIYGPSAIPNTSVSSSISSKAVANPVYAGNNGLNSSNLAYVSGINPVYATIGKCDGVIQPQNNPTELRYANTPGQLAFDKSDNDRVHNLKRVDATGNPPPIPMYADLQSVSKCPAVSPNQDVDTTRNASYGLLGLNELKLEHTERNPVASNSSANGNLYQAPIHVVAQVRADKPPKEPNQ